MDEIEFGHQLVVEIYDDFGNFEGEWTYEVSDEFLEEWEDLDSQDSLLGKTLVRELLALRIEENSPVTSRLLKNNVCRTEFLVWGVPFSIISEIPRLRIVNVAVEKMYNCLSDLVIKENIRIVH